MASQPDKNQIVVRHRNRFAASVSEFLLLFRLRARRVPENAAGVMQRAIRMVVVTCESWFGRGGADKGGPDKRG